MYPVIFLCEEYPRAVVQIDNSRIVLELIDKRVGINLRRAEEWEQSSCLLHLPYQGVYHATTIIEPLRGGDIAYLRVVAELESTVKTYDFRFSRGTVSMYVHNADENVLAGYVRRDDVHNIIRRVFTKIIRSYLLSTTPLCSLLMKLVHRPSLDIERLITKIDTDLSSTYIKRIKILYKPGISIFIRRLNPTRTNVSVICSITYSDKFSDYATLLFDNCTTIIDLRFGRVDSLNGTVSLVLDVFSTRLTRASK